MVRAAGGALPSVGASPARRRRRRVRAGADMVAVNEELKTAKRLQSTCETNTAEVKSGLEVVRGAALRAGQCAGWRARETRR